MKIKKVTARDIQENVISIDRCFKSKGNFKAIRSYFYRPTEDGSHIFKYIQKVYPNAVLLDYGNHYHSFAGSAETGYIKKYFYWVTFKLEEEK